MGKDAQFSRDSQPQVCSSSKMIIFIASHKNGRFFSRITSATLSSGRGLLCDAASRAEVSVSRFASPRCSVCVWTHCRCECCRPLAQTLWIPAAHLNSLDNEKQKNVTFFFLLSPLSINAHCKNPFFSSCTMGNWIKFRAGINVFAASIPPSLNFIFFLLDYSAVVSSQATSDFCVSPDKFIVNQTKDVLTAGVSIYQPHFSSSPPNIMLISLPVFLVSPLRCRALLPVLQPQSAQPLSTGNEEKKREKKNTHKERGKISAKHICAERRTMESVLYWKMSFPSSAIGRQEHYQDP